MTSPLPPPDPNRPPPQDPGDTSTPSHPHLPKALLKESKKTITAASSPLAEAAAAEPSRSQTVGSKSVTFNVPAPTRSSSTGNRIQRAAEGTGTAIRRKSSTATPPTSETSASEAANSSDEGSPFAGRTPRDRGNVYISRKTARPPQVNTSPFQLPPSGSITAFSLQERSRSGRSIGLSQQQISYEGARFLKDGGSSKIYSATIKGEEKILLVNTTIIGIFERRHLTAIVDPLVTTYQTFRSHLLDEVVEIHAIGGFPDPSDPGALRLAIVMEKLEPFPENLTMEQKVGFAKKLLRMQKSMNNNGLLHRDIKPENLLIRDRELVWIDFLDTGTTKKQVREIDSRQELIDYLGDHLAVSQLYSHPDYHALSQRFNTERLPDTTLSLKDLKNEYIKRELANQNVAFAMTIWFLFLGPIPSQGESAFPDLAEMSRQWDNRADVPTDIKQFVGQKLTEPFQGP